ncbi:MAG: MBL fold metallo-hydrolase [Propioniciclava sp.]|uniref:MBL fold metallo-hydrolase n=1 Tax=Propioniciclava sp. TaxID=2038686 RepID=UPI0039E555E4
MFLTSFPAGPWQANTYVFAPDDTHAVVIDPGVGAFDPVVRIVDEHGLTVQGVLLTHGHIDHVATAADVADRYGVPAWIHHADRELLTDPGMPGVPMEVLVAQFGVNLREPSDLRTWSGGETVEVAGASFEIVHAPGHRPGCVLLRHRLPEALPQMPAVRELIFSGDVVFAGSIGRTDLPGGDQAAMITSLRDVVLGLPDAAALLPGHGPQTTMAHERATNPYLQPSFLG